MHSSRSRSILAIMTLVLGIAACGEATDTVADNIVGDPAALAKPLVGHVYSRNAGGGLGAPAGYVFKHELHFLDAHRVQDNAPSAFGNPPEVKTYELAGHDLLIGHTHYVVAADYTTLTDPRGVVFTRQP